MSPTDPETISERGFTLLEILVVLAIAGLITALALPVMSGSQAKADTRAAAREIAAGLRLTRELAMTGGATEAFRIDTAQGIYRAGSAKPSRRVPKGVQLLLVTTVGDRINETEGGIRFFSDGTSSGGGVELAKGGAAETVRVDWLTGRVSIDGSDDAAAR